MQLAINGANAGKNEVDTTSTTIQNVVVNFDVSELFEAANAPVHSGLTIKVLYSAFTTATTPSDQQTLVQNELVSELNNGQLVVSWQGYTYNKTGDTIDSVTVNFTTYNTDSQVQTVMTDSLTIPYSQFQTDMETSITGLLSDVKAKLVAEFTPAEG